MGVLLKYILISMVAASLLLSTGLFAGVSAAEDAEFAALLDAAKAARKKANSVGGEWRDVGKFLKQAEQAAADGDLEKAKKLAHKIKTQCELGYEQAVAQKGKAGHPSYLQ